MIGLIFACFYLVYILRLASFRRYFRSDLGILGIKFFFRSSAIFLSLFALMGPLWGLTSGEITTESRDIYFCIDLSRSMDATDVSPSRLGKIKYELRRIVKRLEGERMGLIIFSSEAFIQSPLTRDISALSLYIDALHTGLVPSRGTDMGSALSLALKKLRAAQASHGAVPSAQAIVLMSDGEDFGQDLSSVIDGLQSSFIRVFTIGVGTLSGGRIPTEGGVKLDSRTGEAVLSKLSSGTLSSIAGRTRGKYFEMTATHHDLTLLSSQLESLKSNKGVRKVTQTAHNKFHYFLYLVLLFLILDALIPIFLLKRDWI